MAGPGRTKTKALARPSEAAQNPHGAKRIKREHHDESSNDAVHKKIRLTPLRKTPVPLPTEYPNVHRERAVYQTPAPVLVTHQEIYHERAIPQTPVPVPVAKVFASEKRRIIPTLVTSPGSVGDMQYNIQTPRKFGKVRVEVVVQKETQGKNQEAEDAHMNTDGGIEGTKRVDVIIIDSDSDSDNTQRSKHDSWDIQKDGLAEHEDLGPQSFDFRLPEYEFLPRSSPNGPLVAITCPGLPHPRYQIPLAPNRPSQEAALLALFIPWVKENMDGVTSEEDGKEMEVDTLRWLGTFKVCADLVLDALGIVRPHGDSGKDEEGDQGDDEDDEDDDVIETSGPARTYNNAFSSPPNADAGASEQHIPYPNPPPHHHARFKVDAKHVLAHAKAMWECGRGRYTEDVTEKEFEEIVTPLITHIQRDVDDMGRSIASMAIRDENKKEKEKRWFWGRDERIRDKAEKKKVRRPKTREAKKKGDAVKSATDLKNMKDLNTDALKAVEETHKAPKAPSKDTGSGDPVQVVQQKKRGRPKGSKNKPKPKPRGRLKGSKNKPKSAVPGDGKEKAVLGMNPGAGVVKRGRGRPRKNA